MKTKGTPAYYDTLFSGLIPCIAESINCGIVTARITKNTKNFKRGEIIQRSGHDIIPRSALYVRSGKYMRNNNYLWRMVGDELTVKFD